MSYQTAIQNLEKKIEYLRSGKPLLIAVRSTMAEMAVRIYEDGQNSTGGDIGQYNSKDEIYVNPNTLPKKVAPRGKPGSSRNVKSRKTVYFKSYKALRDEQGRESGFVNIRLTNDLQSDWANAEIKDGVTSNPKPIEISKHEYHITLKRDVNVMKRRGLESRFGPIFKLTKDEEKFYFNILNKELVLNA